MKYLLIVILLFAFIKAVYYSIFEINENKNKSGGIAYMLFSFIGLILSTIIIIWVY